jgi:hypothetical protein
MAMAGEVKRGVMRAQLQYISRHKVSLSLSLCSAWLACQSPEPPSGAEALGAGGSMVTADMSVDPLERDAELPELNRPNRCRHEGTEGATSRCATPTLDAEHYVTEALKYFDTLDVTTPEDRVPDYAPLVARWEWPPWLLLTGYGAEDMINTGLALRRLDPSTVPERDCRFFDEQPFARCYVTFEYERGPCPIYEEFTFNEAGQTTFIEAWSDLPGLRPEGLERDPWGEGEAFPRLSTRVPGLGGPSGAAPVDSEWMRQDGALDPELQDYRERAEDWRVAWAATLRDADPQFFAIGCGWPTE